MTPRPGSLALALAALSLSLMALGARPAGADAAADRAKAAAAFKQGQAYFQRGDYDRAIPEYQTAFDLSKEPSLIFNIALCHNRANRPEPALAAYKRYLELAPDGNVADEAREEVARLTPIVEKLQADREAQRAAEEARRREAMEHEIRDRPPPPRSPVPLIVGIGGVAIAAVGATFHVLASHTRDRLQSEPDPDAYYTDLDTFKQRRGIAIGGYAVGAATMATALVLGVTVFRRPERPQVSAALAPGGALVTVGWSR
jgi:tetratricopeptide (TPR) repeat protein